MPSSLIDRSFYGNSRQSNACSKIDGLPSGPVETFSTLRMSIFDGLESHPAVDAHAFLPSSPPHGIEGLTRHPDAPKPFSLAEVFGDSMARSMSPSRVSSTASQFAECLAKQSSLSAGSNSFEVNQVYDEYYEEEGSAYYPEDYDEENMADDEYYPSPPPSRTPSSISSRTSRFLNSSNFTPTHNFQSSSLSAPSRSSRFITRSNLQSDLASQAPASSFIKEAPSHILEPSLSAIVPSSALSSDSSCDSMTSDSDPAEGNSSTFSEPEEQSYTFRPTHLPPSIFIPTSTSLKSVMDGGLKSAVTEGSNLVTGLRNVLDDAFTEVSAFIGQGVSRLSEIRPSTSAFSDWEPSPASEDSPKSLISKILFDFFAARQQQPRTTF